MPDASHGRPDSTPVDHQHPVPAEDLLQHARGPYRSRRMVGCANQQGRARPACRRGRRNHSTMHPAAARIPPRPRSGRSSRRRRTVPMYLTRGHRPAPTAAIVPAACAAADAPTPAGAPRFRQPRTQRHQQDQSDHRAVSGRVSTRRSGQSVTAACSLSAARRSLLPPPTAPASTVGRPRRNVATTRPGSSMPR